MKETTLHRHLRHVKAALRWGERQGLLRKAPTIEMPKLVKGQSLAKHRPVVEEEFDRILTAVPKVRPDDARQWERLLRGLWLSGLRLSEALALDWQEGVFVLDATGKYPVFVIDGSGQKSRRSEVVPTTPDFAQWILAETPEAERVGKVFPIVGKTTGETMTPPKAGVVVSTFCRKAGVVVGTTEKTRRDDSGRLVRTTGKAFAGAHDLRRGFCSRWAKRVMPAVLQRLARHSHVTTTMSYYVNLGADDIAADLWANHAPDGNTASPGNTSGNTSGNTRQKTGSESGLETCPKPL